MKELVKKTYHKYKKIIIYFIVGSVATLINALSYYFYRMIINTYEINVILSWVTSLIFAFYLNRKYVFKSKNQVIKEFINFTQYKFHNLLQFLCLMNLYFL